MKRGPLQVTTLEFFRERPQNLFFFSLLLFISIFFFIFHICLINELQLEEIDVINDNLSSKLVNKEFFMMSKTVFCLDFQAILGSPVTRSHYQITEKSLKHKHFGIIGILL